MLEKREFDRNDFMWRLSTTVTAVSGLFSVLVFILLVVNYLQIRAADPINDLQLTELRKQYASDPERDEALAQRIRDLDLLTRKAFFISQGHLRVGGFLLLGGVVVFLVSFKNMARWRPEIPELSETPAAEREWLSISHSRQLVAWVSVAVLAGGLLTAYLTESLVAPGAIETAAQTPPGGGPTAIEAPAKQFPAWETVQLNWPTFRGPGGLGVAHFTNAPTKWDVEAGTGVRWKVEPPKPGANSPVVWDNRLFVTGADEETREIYCYDTKTGELLWSRTLEAMARNPDGVPKVTPETGFAAPTMAVHGDQVFAIFANGDLVSYDFEGNLVWGKGLGLPANHYGHSSSLLAYEGLLFVQYDQTEGSRLMAFDAATGKQAWVSGRGAISWSSPILAHTPAGPQIILCNEEDMDAYDPLSGKRLWTQQFLGGEVAPSPAYRDGIVFAANEFAVASAIQVSGSGDTVQSEIIWEWDELLPEVSSPVGDGERFYFGTTAGDLVCLDAKTGAEVWVELPSLGFYSSPILVGDRIYILDMEGIMYIVRAGAEYELIASLPIGEPTLATPAFMDGRIYVRTVSTLYCIE